MEYRDLAAAQASIKEFLEKIYNRKRLHSALGYRPPREFEQSLSLSCRCVVMRIGTAVRSLGSEARNRCSIDVGNSRLLARNNAARNDNARVSTTADLPPLAGVASNSAMTAGAGSCPRPRAKWRIAVRKGPFANRSKKAASEQPPLARVHRIEPALSGDPSRFPSCLCVFPCPPASSVSTWLAVQV